MGVKVVQIGMDQIRIRQPNMLGMQASKRTGGLVCTLGIEAIGKRGKRQRVKTLGMCDEGGGWKVKCGH